MDRTNILGVLNRISGGRIAKPYLVCANQVVEVTLALNEEKARGGFDDNWEFSDIYIPFPPHYKGIAISGNPNDPQIVYDPWRNRLRIDTKK